MTRFAMTPRRTGTMFGGIMLIAGLVGFVPNRFAGTGALYEANTPHNLVHIATGSAAIVASLLDFGVVATWFMALFYTAFLIVGLAYCTTGFPGTVYYICGGVSLNYTDNVLHAILTALFIAGAVKLSRGAAARGGSGLSQQ